LKSKLALAAVSISLVVSLAANVYFYDMQQHRFASDSALQKQAADLRDQINNLQSEIADLQSQPSHEDAPKLVTRLGARDMRYTYSGQEIRLYISGEVWNVGTVVAENCRLHVTLYQGDIVAKDRYIHLGAINPSSFVEVASNVYYSGIALTNWTLIPEYY
jgi:hypothetical protein